jgi:hypothetical protein
MTNRTGSAVTDWMEFLKDARFRRIIAGVHDDDAFLRHDRHGVGVIQLADKGIDVIGDLLELGFFRRDGVRRRRRRQEYQQQGERDAFHERTSWGDDGRA